MNTNKHESFFIAVLFLLGSLPLPLAFGANYSTEFTGRASKPSRPATTTPSKKSKRPPTIYSTEDMRAAPVAKDPNTTTGICDHKVYRTKTVPRRPASPNSPKLPDAPKAVDRNGYPVADGGAMVLRPGPYLAGWGLCSGGDRRRLWPGFSGIDLSYSWSGGSGGGEFGWCGYRYAWGGDPVYEDASHSAAATDPNTTKGKYTTYSTEDIRPPDDRHRPSPLSDANEPRQDVPASEKPKHEAKAAESR